MMAETSFAAALPAGLARSTVKAALAYTSAKAAGAAALSEKVFVLSEGVIRMMWLNKMKMAAGVVLAVMLAGTGIGFVARQTWAGGDEQVQREQPAPQGAKNDAKRATQEDSKGEIAQLRKEIARLREEVKLLAARQQGSAAQDSGASYRGKSTAFWLSNSTMPIPSFGPKPWSLSAFSPERTRH